MKAWLVVFPIAIALPSMAGAQAIVDEDARAAELACQLGGLCGELAQAEAEREKEAIEGVETRGPLSLGAMLAAGKGTGSASVATRTPTANATTPARAKVATRGARRNITASVGHRAPVVGTSAVDVPESLAARAPLFVTFGLNSAKLTPESAAEVRGFAKALKQIAASGQDKRFRIEGHTDASGSEEFNRSLSEQRAAAVREALLAEGIDGSRIEVAGMGSNQPIDGYAKTDPVNRRVEAAEIR